VCCMEGWVEGYWCMCVCVCVCVCLYRGVVCCVEGCVGVG